MRTLGGETSSGNALLYPFYLANGVTVAVGDLVALDTTANQTVKDSVNDAAPLGRVEAIEGPTTATSATSTIVTVRVFGFTQVVKLPTDAAIAVGVSIQTNVAGSNNIETTGNGTGRTLVISDPGGAGDALVLA